jgi:hypothetical protein
MRKNKNIEGGKCGKIKILGGEKSGEIKISTKNTKE